MGDNVTPYVCAYVGVRVHVNERADVTSYMIHVEQWGTRGDKLMRLVGRF